MESEARFDELLGLIYEAGLEPSGWERFLDSSRLHRETDIPPIASFGRLFLSLCTRA